MRRGWSCVAGIFFVLLACAALGASAWARGSYETAPRNAVTVSELPSEARHTVELIRRGGPFPYTRDGAVFGNFERVLPSRSHAYYREYTVRTPGAKDRGARRIIAGAGGEFYYTDDHYRTFRRIVP